MHFSFDPSDATERQAALAVIGAFDAAHSEAPTPPTAHEQAVAAAAPAPVDPTAGETLDANGTPWLADYHTGNKTQTKAGVWKRKPGTDAAEVAAAEEAARAKLAGAVPPAPVEQMPAPVTPEQVPQPTVSMEEVTETWNVAVQAGVVDPAQALAIYEQLGIDPAAFQTNETFRAKFKAHLDALMHTPAPMPGAAAMPGV